METRGTDSDTYMIHRGPISAPIHGAQRVIERFVASHHRRRRRGYEERGGGRGGWDSEGGVVCRDVGVEVERGGVWFRFAVFLLLGWVGFAGAGLGGYCVGFVVPSDRQGVVDRDGEEQEERGRTAGTF